MKIKKEIDKLIEKDVTRKQFIVMAGIFLVAIPFLSKSVLAQVLFRNEAGNKYTLDDLINKIYYGTGDPPSPSGLSEGSLYFKYTP